MTPEPTDPSPDGAHQNPTADNSAQTQQAVSGSAASPESVTVRQGDTLWWIASRSLSPGATQADIDNAWRAWYFVNQEVIGDDPDLIVPGQTLVAPAQDREPGA